MALPQFLQAIEDNNVILIAAEIKQDATHTQRPEFVAWSMQNYDWLFGDKFEGKTFEDFFKSKRKEEFLKAIEADDVYTIRLLIVTEEDWNNSNLKTCHEFVQWLEDSDKFISQQVLILDEMKQRHSPQVQNAFLQLGFCGDHLPPARDNCTKCLTPKPTLLNFEHKTIAGADISEDSQHISIWFTDGSQLQIDSDLPMQLRAKS